MGRQRQTINVKDNWFTYYFIMISTKEKIQDRAGWRGQAVLGGVRADCSIFNKVNTWGLIEKRRFTYTLFLFNATKITITYSYSTSMSLTGDILAVMGFIIKKIDIYLNWSSHLNA